MNLTTILQIGLGLGLVSFTVFFVWRLVHNAREQQEKINQAENRAEASESLLNSVIEGKDQENKAEEAAKEARKNAKDNPLGDWK